MHAVAANTLANALDYILTLGRRALDKEVLRLHVAVHHAVRVAPAQRAQQLPRVAAHRLGGEARGGGLEHLQQRALDVLKHQVLQMGGGGGGGELMQTLLLLPVKTRLRQAC